MARTVVDTCFSAALVHPVAAYRPALGLPARVSGVPAATVKGSVAAPPPRQRENQPVLAGTGPGVDWGREGRRRDSAEDVRVLKAEAMRGIRGGGAPGGVPPTSEPTTAAAEATRRTGRGIVVGALRYGLQLLDLEGDLKSPLL